MKNRGYAISAIVYPLLLICLVLILSILQNLNNKQTLLNNLKSIIKNENNEINSVCEYVVGTEWTFDYSGSPEEFTVPCNGTYKLETWGAQGGTASLSSGSALGGNGGYSYGNITLTNNDILNVIVGSKGTDSSSAGGTFAGGYNGGGTGYSSSSKSAGAGGGGATHIALGTTNRGELNNYEDYKEEVLIVAGGGGGAVIRYYTNGSLSNACAGGTGGGTTGGSSTETIGGTYATGGTQTSGYGFGIGGNGSSGSVCNGGGGGGYYGGNSTHSSSPYQELSGGGGSGYIGGVTDGTTENGVREGNGYAKITLVSIDNQSTVDSQPIVEVEVLTNKANFTITDDIGIIAYGVSKSDTEAPQYTSIESTLSTIQTWNTTEKGIYYVWVKDTGGNITIKDFEILNVCAYEIGQTWTFDYSGSPEEFKTPCSGTYKLEVWGAQGGSINTTYYGGYGAYSKGNIDLQKDDNLFVTVGGSGSYRVNNTDEIAIDGGYNGGGNGYGMWSDSPGFSYYNTSGGGATHVAFGTTNRGILYNYKDYKDEIVMVAAGGGASSYMYYSNEIYENSIGGHAGGIEGSKYTVTYNESFFEQYFCGFNNANQEQASSHCYNGTITASTFGFGAIHINGGGGGYYGGTGSGFGGTGGSSYINNSQLYDKAMYCYNCKESNVEGTKTITTTNVSSSPVSEYAKMGNGYAQITLVSID